MEKGLLYIAILAFIVYGIYHILNDKFKKDYSFIDMINMSIYLRAIILVVVSVIVLIVLLKKIAGNEKKGKFKQVLKTQKIFNKLNLVIFPGYRPNLFVCYVRSDIVVLQILC